MRFPVPVRRYDPNNPEMIDDPNADLELLGDELKSIRSVNRFFGGYSAVRRGLLALLDKGQDSEEIRILDLGTGSADLPVYLMGLGRQLQKKIIITAVDNHPLILQIARERTKANSNLIIEKANLLELKYPPGMFDVVLCSLTLHHFSFEEIVEIMRSMKQLCRIGFVVNDLRRSWIAAWTTWLYMRFTTRNPMTRKDSYLSVLRGFTADELKRMALQAGVEIIESRRQAFFRLLLIGRHD